MLPVLPVDPDVRMERETGGRVKGGSAPAPVTGWFLQESGENAN